MARPPQLSGRTTSTCSDVLDVLEFQRGYIVGRGERHAVAEEGPWNGANQHRRASCGIRHGLSAVLAAEQTRAARPAPASAGAGPRPERDVDFGMPRALWQGATDDADRDVSPASR